MQKVADGRPAVVAVGNQHSCGYFYLWEAIQITPCKSGGYTLESRNDLSRLSSDAVLVVAQSG